MKAFSEGSQGSAVIYIPRGQRNIQEVPRVIDNEMKFETIKPSHRRFRAFSMSSKDPMRGNPPIITDPQACRIHEGDTATGTELRRQIKLQKRQDFFLQLHEARITHEMSERCPPIDTDVFKIKVLKRPRVAFMEGDQERHHFAWMQTSRTPRVSESPSLGRQCFEMYASYSRKSRLFRRKVIQYSQGTPFG